MCQQPVPRARRCVQSHGLRSPAWRLQPGRVLDRAGLAPGRTSSVASQDMFTEAVLTEASVAGACTLRTAACSRGGVNDRAGLAPRRTFPEASVTGAFQDVCFVAALYQ